MGRKKALCREWLTRGVRVAAAAGGADGRAGVSGVLGWLARLVVWSRELGRPTCDAGLVCGLSRPSRLRGFLLFFSFLFLFYFSSSLFEFKFDLEFEFKSGVPYSLEF